MKISVCDFCGKPLKGESRVTFTGLNERSGYYDCCGTCMAEILVHLHREDALGDFGLLLPEKEMHGD